MSNTKYKSSLLNKKIYRNEEEKRLRGQLPILYCFLAFVSRFFTACFSLFSLLFLSLDSFCQPGAEVGVIGGVGYYLGEYNAGGHFKYNQNYMGILYRYNLNDRFAIRLNTGFSKIDIQEKSLLTNGEITYSDGFHCKIRDISEVLWFEK